MPLAEWPEIGRDELDRPPAAVEDNWWRRLRRWLVPGGHATAAPTLLFVLLGVTLGPHGLAILSVTVVGHLEAVVWVALAVIGVFLGLGIAEVSARTSARVFVSGVVTPLITVAAVAAGLYLLFWQARVPLTGDPLAGSILIGICASVSAALRPGSGASAELRRAAHLADLDDIPLLVVGVTIVAAIAAEAPVLRLLATLAAGGAIGLAGWLLFERADESERGVFLTGAVLLIAGIGAYLGTSPLLSGCIAAIVWVRAPGAADRITARDLRTLQHPLVALLLIIAGATLEWTAMVLWVTGAIVVLRFAAKLLAAVAVAPFAGVSPALLATVLLQPGIMGIALALNAGRMLGADYLWIVSAVTTAALVSEVLAAFLPHDHHPEPQAAAASGGAE
jgi:hypothetical protein